MSGMRLIGLVSGTSMDGIDAAAVHVRARGERLAVDLEGFRTVPYPAPVAQALRRHHGPGKSDRDELAALSIQVGRLFGRAAARVAGGAGKLPQYDAIGSHGQTLLHRPGAKHAFSLQIGDGATIAQQTGLPVVYDFRSADLAGGGEGAPVLPIADYLLLRSGRRDRAVLNLGGVANLTWLPRAGGWGGVRSFDTGPANALSDRIMQSRYDKPYDRDGRLALSGSVDEALLERLLRHPYFRRRPPKSTGFEEFGDAFAKDALRGVRRNRIPDVLATLAALTARTAAAAFGSLTRDPFDLALAGGGASNRAIARALQEAIPHARFVALPEWGQDAASREAIGFAVLAHEFLRGRRYVMKHITGSKSVAPLGVLAPGEKPYTLRFPLDRNLS
ncbi:MAG: anhydro-N-acetylmuramic acid kinase [Gemmatimonadetes bacterium]|nr:anhydro-N-acetylmuramic acid kinase [Gemmatimonadota bacterium]